MKITNLLDSASTNKPVATQGPIGKLSSKIKKAAKVTSNFVTGGTRQQSYGYTSKFFYPEKEKDRNGTATPLSKNSVPDQTPMSTQSTNISESFDKMFSFMKKSHEENVRMREISQNFAEETQDNEDRRHGELMESMREFTKVDTATQITNTAEEGGIFATIKAMLKKVYGELTEMMSPFLNFMKVVGTKLLEFGRFLITNPSTMSYLLYAIGLWKAKDFLDKSNYGERMAEGEGKMAEAAFKNKKTDFTGLKLTKDEATAILEQQDSPAKTRDIVAFGGIERITSISKGLPDPGGKLLTQRIDPNSKIATNQTENFKQQKSAIQNSTATQASKITEQPNVILKTAEPVNDSPTKFLAEKQTITPAAIPPKTDALNKVTAENNDLNNSAIQGIRPAPKPVVISNSNGTTVNESPMSTTATQRDDTPILDFVMNKLKAAY
jgi:hypothetical protein